MILPRQEVVAEDLGKREGEVHDKHVVCHLYLSMSLDLPAYSALFC